MLGDRVDSLDVAVHQPDTVPQQPAARPQQILTPAERNEQQTGLVQMLVVAVDDRDPPLPRRQPAP